MHGPMYIKFYRKTPTLYQRLCGAGTVKLEEVHTGKPIEHTDSTKKVRPLVLTL